MTFPFLFGGAFIEGPPALQHAMQPIQFPFLFGGAFIEGRNKKRGWAHPPLFPFLFGGAFIEGQDLVKLANGALNFPSFSEGLSLRDIIKSASLRSALISLPFRRGFH